MSAPSNSANCAMDETFRIIGVTFTSIVLTTSIILNGGIVLLIFIQKNLRSSTNLYIAQFSFVLIMQSIVLIIDIVDVGFGEFVFPSFICRASAFILESLIIMSTCVLLLISYNRYSAISDFAKYVRNTGRMKTELICGWVLSFLFGSPFALMYHTKKDSCNKSRCQYDYFTDLFPKIYFTAETVFIYIVPITVLSVFYIKIISLFNKKMLFEKKFQDTVNDETCGADITRDCNLDDGDGDSDKEFSTTKELDDQNGTSKPISSKKKNRLKESKLNKRKMNVIPILFIVGLYILMWTPFIIVRLLVVFHVKVPYIWKVVQAFWLLYPAFYPLVYVSTSPVLRNAIKKMITG